MPVGQDGCESHRLVLHQEPATAFGSKGGGIGDAPEPSLHAYLDPGVPKTLCDWVWV